MYTSAENAENAEKSTFLKISAENAEKSCLFKCWDALCWKLMGFCDLKNHKIMVTFFMSSYRLMSNYKSCQVHFSQNTYTTVWKLSYVFVLTIFGLIFLLKNIQNFTANAEN